MNRQRHELIYAGRECERLPEEVFQEAFVESVLLADFSFNGLRVLDGIERLPSLEVLVADNNRLDDASTRRLGYMPYLHTLSLNNNRLQDADVVLWRIRERAPRLRHLSLLGNPLSPSPLSFPNKDDDDYRRFRIYVIWQIPTLRFLDSGPVEAKERNEALRSGHLMRPVRLSAIVSFDDDVDYNSDSRATSSGTSSPKSSSTAAAGEHRTQFGYCKYHYVGRQSEGNKFIRDADL